MARMSDCPNCGSPLVQPLRSQAQEDGGMLVDLRCPECFAWRQAACTPGRPRRARPRSGRVARVAPALLRAVRGREHGGARRVPRHGAGARPHRAGRLRAARSRRGLTSTRAAGDGAGSGRRWRRPEGEDRPRPRACRPTGRPRRPRARRRRGLDLVGPDDFAPRPAQLPRPLSRPRPPGGSSPRRRRPTGVSRPSRKRMSSPCEVDVDEAAQLAVVAGDPVAQLAVLRVERLEHLADGAARRPWPRRRRRRRRAAGWGA